MGGNSSTISIQSFLYNKENQEQFIVSMNSTSPLFSDSLENSTIVKSQATAINYFCFFTGGSNKRLKFWQLKNFFVISLQVHNPKIKLFHAIVHTFKDVKFLSTYIDKVAFASMISFMDGATASISRELYIKRILDLYKNNDSLLYSKVYPLHRIRLAELSLDIAEPTLIGRSAYRHAQEESFSTTASEHSNKLVVNSEYLEMPSTISGTDSNTNSINKRKNRNQKINPNKSAPELKNRQFDIWSTIANDTTSVFQESTSEFSPRNKTKKQTNLEDDSQLSSCFNPLSEPDSVNKSGLSTMLNSSYSPTDSSMIDGNVSSSSPQISEPGLYESNVSQTFKNAQKRKSRIRLHKHHNLDTDEFSDFSKSSTVTVSESFFSPSTTIESESNSHRRSSRRKRNQDENENGHRRRRRQGENDDDDSYYSISYSDRSVASKAAKIHIFTDSDEKKRSTAPSFVSEVVMSSTTGRPSRKRRNVGLDVNLRHDVGFTSSEQFKESSESSSSYISNKKSNRSGRRSKNRQNKSESISDNTFDQNDNLNRIHNRKKDESIF